MRPYCAFCLRAVDDHPGEQSSPGGILATARQVLTRGWVRITGRGRGR